MILQRVECSKYLGVFIDRKITWQDHIDYVYEVHHVNLVTPDEILYDFLFSVDEAFATPFRNYTNVEWNASSISKIKQLIYALHKFPTVKGVRYM